MLEGEGDVIYVVVIPDAFSPIESFEDGIPGPKCIWIWALESRKRDSLST